MARHAGCLYVAPCGELDALVQRPRLGFGPLELWPELELHEAHGTYWGLTPPQRALVQQLTPDAEALTSWLAKKDYAAVLAKARPSLVSKEEAPYPTATPLASWVPGTELVVRFVLDTVDLLVIRRDQAPDALADWHNERDEHPRLWFAREEETQLARGGRADRQLGIVNEFGRWHLLVVPDELNFVFNHWCLPWLRQTLGSSHRVTTLENQLFTGADTGILTTRKKLLLADRAAWDAPLESRPNPVGLVIQRVKPKKTMAQPSLPLPPPPPRLVPPKKRRSSASSPPPSPKKRHTVWSAAKHARRAIETFFGMVSNGEEPKQPPKSLRLPQANLITGLLVTVGRLVRERRRAASEVRAFAEREATATTPALAEALAAQLPVLHVRCGLLAWYLAQFNYATLDVFKNIQTEELVEDMGTAQYDMDTLVASFWDHAERSSRLACPACDEQLPGSERLPRLSKVGAACSACASLCLVCRAIQQLRAHGSTLAAALAAACPHVDAAHDDEAERLVDTTPAYAELSDAAMLDLVLI